MLCLWILSLGPLAEQAEQSFYGVWLAIYFNFYDGKTILCVNLLSSIPELLYSCLQQRYLLGTFSDEVVILTQSLWSPLLLLLLPPPLLPFSSFFFLREGLTM